MGALRGRAWILCVAPAVLLLVGGLIFPLARGRLPQFPDLPGADPVQPGWLTLDNYSKFFTDPYYLTALSRTSASARRLPR